MAPDPDYELFAKVVESGSLSAAGRKIGASPATVSRRLARLETRLGVRLLNRTTRKAILTDAGLQFHEDVLAILAAIETAEVRLAGRQSQPSGALRISAPTSFGRLHIAPYLDRFLEAHPLVALEFDLSDGYIDLVAERMDLVVRIAREVGPGLVAKFLTANRRILCASPEYIARHAAPTDVTDLERHRLLAATGQSPWRLIGPKGELALDISSHVRTNSSEVVRELAIAGVGIALRSIWDVCGDLAAGRLVRILPSIEGDTGFSIYAVYPVSPLVPRSVMAFVEHLESIYNPRPPWETGSASQGAPLVSPSV
jgi:DNA-binding transcriptional LysR family regulator